MNKEIINVLLKEVEKSFNNNEVPVGAVIFDEDYNIVSKGHNDRQFNSSVLGHAEINAILEAEKKLEDWRLDGYNMIVSLEPCEMCSIIIKECRLNKVYYLLTSNLKNNVNINKKKIECDEVKKIKKIMKEFFKDMR